MIDLSQKNLLLFLKFIESKLVKIGSIIDNVKNEIVIQLKNNNELIFSENKLDDQ